MTTRTFADQSVIKNFVDIRSRALFTLSQTFSNNNTFENPIFWYCVRIHVLRSPLQSSVKQSVTMSARATFVAIHLEILLWTAMEPPQTGRALRKTDRFVRLYLSLLLLSRTSSSQDAISVNTRDSLRYSTACLW
jgi:hypothetical protein